MNEGDITWNLCVLIDGILIGLGWPATRFLFFNGPPCIWLVKPEYRDLSISSQQPQPPRTASEEEITDE